MTAMTVAATSVYDAFHNVAVASLIAALPGSGPDWLDGARRELIDRQPAHLRTEVSVGWWELNLDITLEMTPPPGPPLARIDRRDALLLVAAGIVETDVPAGALYARLQDPLLSRRPCIGLLDRLLAPAVDEVALRVRRLAVRGLVDVVNPDDPRAEQIIRVPSAVWDVVCYGRTDAGVLPAGLELVTAEQFPELREIAIARHQRGELEQAAELVLSGEVATLAIRGMTGSGRRTMLGSIARLCDSHALHVSATADPEACRLASALCELGGWFAIAIPGTGPGETAQVPRMSTPMGIVLGRTGGVAGPGAEQAVSLSLDPIDAEQRASLWSAGAPGLANVEHIARRFLLTPGAIHRAAPLAATLAAHGGRDVTEDDVRAATRSLDRRELETAATALDPVALECPPVLSVIAQHEMDALILRCLHREQLASEIGSHAPATANHGVRALFSGPSGTGKTLAARYLGACLRTDVYRIDLAATVNKYVGETERNLDRVLSRAEELDVILLLDEGDSLMAKRTDVSTANDRYANLETNFLLQRLDTYLGIAVITTNAASRIDPAFLRRIDVTIDFAPPDADERWQILLTHLPCEHDIENGVLEDVARRCALTGGQLRNTVLHAGLLAIAAQRRITSDDLLAAVRREYRRSGASCPLPEATL